nr:Lrp/AsnC ligand binding domain-containing protein [Candidatus Njordarchaeota archaeon]
MPGKDVRSEVEAFILVKVEAEKEKEVTSGLTNKMITEANLIYGAYDLILKLVSPLPEKLDESIFGELRRINDVKETATCIVASKVK